MEKFPRLVGGEVGGSARIDLCLLCALPFTSGDTDGTQKVEFDRYGAG